MIVYRVSNLMYKELTLSGTGAEKVGGRWNEAGTRAVYCSENISLALLEYYIHAAYTGYLPKNILVAKIFFPDTFKIIELKHLPEGWNQYPYTSQTTKIFTDLAQSRDFFALKVPSSIVGLESNIILNPLYRKFEKVEVVEFFSLPIDERLTTIKQR